MEVINPTALVHNTNQHVKLRKCVETKTLDLPKALPPPPETRACGCDPCECDLQEDECIPDDIIEPVVEDHSNDFYDQLQINLTDFQHQYCHEMVGKPDQFPLSQQVIRKLLLERKEVSKVYCYLPGNELYPKLLKHRVNDGDMCNICSVLASSRTVTHVNLAYNDIGDRGLKRLANTIRICGNISHVNLMHNDFGSGGLMFLVKALLSRAPLQTLRLTGVKLGDDGIDVLACLILSGRAPLDLDIGECDLSVTGFQTICSALHALDHDINQTHFLNSRNLPIDLGKLARIKCDYNEELSQVANAGDEVAMLQKWAYKKKEKGKDNQGKSSWDVYQKLKMDRKYRDEEHGEEDTEIPLIFQEISSTLLQGLFNQQHKLSSTEIPLSSMPGSMLGSVQSLSLNIANSQSLVSEVELIERSRQISEEVKELGSLDEYIVQYKTEEEKVTKDEDYYKYPVVSPSLYKLDYDQAEHLLNEFTYEIDNPDRYEREKSESKDWKPKMGMYHGQVIDFNQSILKKSIDEAEARTDEFTANEAARLAAQSFIHSAAETVEKSDEISEQSNIIQLLYMTLVELAKARTNFMSTDHTVRDCEEMVDTAIEQLHTFLMTQTQIPEQCTQLSEDLVRNFVRSLVQTASGTFLKLLDNEQMAKALAKDGSFARRQATLREQENDGVDGVEGNEAQIRYIAMQFLNGAIEEASQLIGSGDPFHFNRHHQHEHEHEDGHGKESSQQNEDEILANAQQIFDTESGICDAIGNLMEFSGQLAATIKQDNRELREAEKLFQEAATEFVSSLFEDVRETLGEYIERVERPDKEEETDKEALMKLKFRFISRPTRLVLNRPFFRNYEELMATKLGEYLGGNHTLKSLHLQKWGLGEDGMAGLMNGLIKNKTIRILDLGCNGLGADGIKILGQWMATNKHLKHLVLNHNGLKDPGIKNLTAHITESNLTSLKIAHNDITWNGLDSFLEVIPVTKIRALYLWGNSFGLQTWQLWKELLENGYILHTDTLLQQIDENTFCTVKNSQVRDTNQYYDVPPQHEGLQVPPYLTDPVHARGYQDK